MQSHRQPQTRRKSKQPGNYMTIVQNSGPIKQNFLIDPALSVPSTLLPPRTPYESVAYENNVKVIQRNNLNIIAKRGEIDTNIVVMESDRQTNFRVDVRSRGDIEIRLLLPGTISPDDPIRPGPLCLMNVYSSSGNIYLWIPRERLEGPLNVTARRDVQFSTALLEDLNIFNEREKWWKKRRECFIGNLAAWSEGAGDVINLKAKAGSVFVQYIGEAVANDGVYHT
ncbi:uncharacterized protein EV420DRAFT_1577396 [Desarmillaria tabescens]|uniref:DUF7330 domain-containing protein n=1 Tax=Armillaria tabescens TaxID=1929756 RepID=A0AA39JHA0_ARMTA|nr:uncharacterized protein EV420DRAFT_1577396 [Desarmillaria tabescens]KAK0442746.1 hypothetical protein EV420DRAFT_1577396 [Desarmillaria tabescens]